MNLLLRNKIPNFIIRKFRYLRLSITKRCNLRCLYCNPREKKGKDIDSEKLLTPSEIRSIVFSFSKLNPCKVRITGGEPLLRGDVVDIIAEVKRTRGIREIGITTNGVLLRDSLKELKRAGLNRVNISLPSLSPERYKEITGGDIEYVLSGIETCVNEGMYTKINTVAFGQELIREIPLFIELLKEFDVQLRFIEYMPLCTDRYKREKFVDLSKVEEILINEYNFSAAKYNKNIFSKIYKRNDLRGEIGFIKPVTHQFCDVCNKIRISPKGELIPCLFSSERLNILELMKNYPKDYLFGEIFKFILKNHKKPDIRSFIDNDIIPSKIFEVGG